MNADLKEWVWFANLHGIATRKKIELLRFFECPRDLKRAHPDLYDVFREYYCQDPEALYASWKGAR